MAAVHAVVSGRVQGVFFRQTCRQLARRLGLVGWVRNRPDGTVEVWAQGDGEAVDKLVEWLWQGPPKAQVVAVETSSVAPDLTLQDFLIQQ